MSSAVETRSGRITPGQRTDRYGDAIQKRLLLIPWLVVGLLALLVGLTTPGSDTTTAWSFAVLSIALGTWLFLGRGAAIDAVALVHFAFLVFVGIASVIALANPEEWRLTYYPVAICYFAHLLTSAILPTSTPEYQGRLRLSIRITNWTFFWGVGYLIVGIAATRRYPESLGPVPDSIAFVGVCLLGMAALGGEGRLGVLKWAAVVVGLLAYSNYVFTGFGRLTLVGLFMVIVAIAAMRWRRKLIKVALLALTWPALLVLSDYSGLGLASRGEGSAISPITTFQRLIDLQTHGSLNLEYGHSFFAAAVALVPKDIWPDKPIGLALELAYIFNPQYARYGHTDVALVYGEGLINFGFVGIPLISIGMAFWCAWIARRQTKLMRAFEMTKAQVILLLMVLIAASGVIDLFWTGTFTYVARSGTRVLVLLPVLLTVAATKRREERKVDQPTKRRLVPV